MGFILPSNPVIRMASRLGGLLRPLPFLLLSLVKRKDAMSRGMMLLVLAAVIGYSANRFDVLENFVPVMKSVGAEVAPAAQAIGVYMWEGEPGKDIFDETKLCGLGRAGLWIAAVIIVIWILLGVACMFDEGSTLFSSDFPGGFQILSEEKCWKVWAVAIAILFLPLEAVARPVARLVYIAIRIVLDPCIFVYKFTVRGLNYDLSKLAEKKVTELESPTESPESQPSEPPQSLRSHWDPRTD